jgi:hypothetical protein
VIAISSLCPPRYVEGPVATPSRFGLYSVAQLLDDLEPHDMGCGVISEPFACGVARSTSPVCPPVEPTPKAVPDGIASVEGEPFTVVAGVHCRLPGRSGEDFQQRASAALALGEQREVERVFWTGTTTDGGTGTLDPHLAQPGCTILNTTPGAAGAFDIVSAIAALEDFAAATYSGTDPARPPGGRTAATGSLAVRDGSSPVTQWAHGFGPATPREHTVAPAGTTWIYVTGAVQIRRSEGFYTPPTVAG